MTLGQTIAKRIIDGAMKPENLKLTKKAKNTLVSAGGLIVVSIVASIIITNKK
jgi:hypothetical protein